MNKTQLELINFSKNYHNARHLDEIGVHNISPDILNVHNNQEEASYNEKTKTVKIVCEVMGTQYEGRSNRIEFIHKNDVVTLRRDKNNEYDKNCINVLNSSGESLGNISSDVCDVLSPIIDSKLANIKTKVSYVEPLSQRSTRAKRALLYVEIAIELIIGSSCEAKSVVCFVGGDQLRTWVQKIEVMHIDIPIEDVKLIFEVINRKNNEYDIDNNDVSYVGLDYLADEISFIRKRIRNEADSKNNYEPFDEEFDTVSELFEYAIKSEANRYGILSKYLNEEYEFEEELLRSVFENHCIDENDYYWIEETRVSENEFDGYSDGYNHWYDCVELFNEIPVDLADEDVVTIFGSGKGVALIDLSYGC